MTSVSAMCLISSRMELEQELTAEKLRKRVPAKVPSRGAIDVVHDVLAGLLNFLLTPGYELLHAHAISTMHSEPSSRTDEAMIGTYAMLVIAGKP